MDHNIFLRQLIIQEMKLIVINKAEYALLKEIFKKGSGRDSAGFLANLPHPRK